MSKLKTISTTDIVEKKDLSYSNDAISKYIKSVNIMSKSTAYEYLFRLNYFKAFIKRKFGSSNVDIIIKKVKNGNQDPYDLLSDYSLHLQNSGISALTLKQRIITVKNFFEYHDVDISPRKFKFKVKLPRTVKKNKEALSKEDIIEILNACSDIRLKTYVMFLAAGGFRAVEGLSLRIKDLELESKPARVFLRGEYTKTKTDRVIFLTDEVTQQLRLWLDYKYRTRRVCFKDERTGKTIAENRTPERKETDLLFAIYQQRPDPNRLYDDFGKSFAKTLDRVGKGAKEDGNTNRRQITFHSFRRFVKTTISDLGYADYSEYFIGHSGSTYWRKKDSEKADIFRKIEPYLTFLNVHQLERHGADMESEVEELKDLNQSLINHDKMKDDAIAHLSDQLVAITTRLQEVERRQLL